MTGFTEGPWELREDDMGGVSALIYPQGSEYPVAAVTGYHASAGQRLPNARLIAAAPELLMALEHALAWHDEGAPIPTWVYEAQAAIAKATQ